VARTRKPAPTVSRSRARRAPTAPAPSFFRVHAAVFAAIVVVLLLTTDDRHAGAITDGRQMTWTAIAIAESGSIGQAPGRDLAVPRARGDSVSRYGMGMSLAQVPAALLAPVVERRLGPASSQPLFLVAPFVFVLLAAAAAGLAARELGLDRRAQATAILLASLAGPLASYAALDLAEPLLAAALAGAFVAAVTAVRREGRRRALLAAAAGAAAGVAVLTKSSMLVVAPLALLPLLAAPRTLPAAMAGFAPIAGLWLSFEIVRFGRPLASYAGETFSHPFLDGLWRLLVGVNAGLVWFFPAVAAVAVGFGRVTRSWTRWDGLVEGGALLPSAALVALAAPWWAWHGSAGWGPRLLVPAVPLLAVLAAREMGRWPRQAATGLLALSIVLNLPPLLQHPVPPAAYVLACDWPEAPPSEASSLPRFAWREVDGTVREMPGQVLATVPEASPFVVLPWFFWARRAPDASTMAERLDRPPWREARPDIVPPGPLAPETAAAIARGGRWNVWGRGFRPSPADLEYTRQIALGNVYDTGLANQVLRAQHMGQAALALRLVEKLARLAPSGATDALVLESYRLLGRRADAVEYLSGMTIEHRQDPAVNVVLALFERDRGAEPSARELLASVAPAFEGAALQQALAAPLAQWPADFAAMTAVRSIEVPLAR